MPGYHSEGDGDRYRGHGRGGMGWGGRDGGGGRGYSHGGGGGGGRYNDRYRWNDEGEGGSRQGPSRGYKDNYSHHRYRDGYSGGSSHHYHHHHSHQSWQDRGQGSEGYSRRPGGDRRGGPDFIKSLTTELGHISGKDSRIALDILKSVLNSEAPNRDHWDYGPPARKMRRLDWDGARSQHMHKYPYRERPYHPGHHEYRGRGRGGAGMVPRSPHCYRKMSNSQLREMEMARSEMPHPDKKEKKDLERKTSGVKRVREGDEEKEKASAEGTAGEEGTQSEEKKEKETGEGEGDSEEAKEKSEDQEAAKKDTKEEKEEEAKEKKETETDESRDPNIVFPRTALKCHMCDMTKFPNIKAYLSHLGSKNHERIAHVFHSRCATSMDLLIAESKLANKRKSKLRSKTRWCSECDCVMNPNPKEHCHSTEHTLVSRYMEVQCCGYVYNRANVEEHRLSMRHLKNQIAYDEAQQAKKEREKELRAVSKEEEAAFHREVAEFKQCGLEQQEEEGLEPLTVANMPPHDPAKPIGLEMLYKETRYQCDVCHCNLDSPRQARYHFRSLEHYHSICNQLTAIEEAKELERKKKEEEEKAAKAKEEGQEEGKEKEDKTKEDAEEEDEDMTNMETVDVAEEDGEGEGEEEEEEHDDLEEAAGGGDGGEEEEEEEEEQEGDRSKDQTNEEDESSEVKESTEHQEGEEGEGEDEEQYDEEMEGEYGEEEEEEEEDGGMIEGLDEEGEDYDEGLNSEDEGEREEEAA